MENIVEKIKAIAIYRVFYVKSIWELAINKGDHDSDKKQSEGNAFFSINAVKSVGSSLGLEFSEIDIMPTGNDIVYPVKHFQKNCIDNDRLTQNIEKSYGVSARRIFEISQFVAIVFELSSLFSHFPDSEYDDFLRNRNKEVFTFFDSFVSLYKSSIGSITLDYTTSNLFGNLIEHLEKNTTINQDFYVQTASLSVEIVANLVPAFSEMTNRATRAAQLMSELRACKPGHKDWTKYETICIEILQFLFVPPFRSVFVQVRTSDGYERRDAVLPNNQYDGFYGALRQEFETKNIVCEFKNIAAKFDKSLLNQLRIYLSKPTVGRFGLLFIRTKPNAILLKAQRDAYEQSRILVLIINDELISDLMMARVYLGSVETIIENEKTRFEMEY